MAVQAQLYSDHNQNNINMGLSNNLPVFGSQDWVFMSGSSVFEENRVQQQEEQDHNFLESQEIMNAPDYHNLLKSSSSRRNSTMGFQYLDSELQRQRLEMNCFLHFQKEKLKAIVNEESRRREAMLMENYELKMKSIFDEKDQVLATATNRTRELQNCLLMAEKEAKEWEKKAIENEAIAIDLNSKLCQAKERQFQDAESVCDYGDDEREERRIACKACHVRSSCVLLLPCRHLCSCSHCEALLVFCPLCGTLKNGSLEVFFGLN